MGSWSARASRMSPRIASGESMSTPCTRSVPERRCASTSNGGRGAEPGLGARQRRQVQAAAGGCAVAAARERVVLVLQTITNTPFGPLAVAPSRGQPGACTRCGRSSRSAPSCSATSLARRLDPPSCGFRLRRRAVPRCARRDRGYVTMVNPCLEKGVDVFLALARDLLDVEFAAVRGWGTDPARLASSRSSRTSSFWSPPTTSTRSSPDARAPRALALARDLRLHRSRRRCSAAFPCSRATPAACGSPRSAQRLCCR